MSVIGRNIANKTRNIKLYFSDAKVIKICKVLIPTLFIIIGLLILVTIILIARFHSKKHEHSNEPLDRLFNEEYKLKTNEEKQEALKTVRSKVKKVNFDSYDDGWHARMANSGLSIEGLNFISREPSIDENIKRIDSLIDLFNSNL